MTRKDNAYIHGTEPAEQSRLAALNRLTNRPFVEFLGVRPGDRVLEVGSGLGILAADVASSADGVRVVGVERSAEQIAAASPAPGVTLVQGDAHRLDFPDASFDVVYARYLLEHVADPAQVLAEMRRVVRPDGRVAVQENDISLIRFDPDCPAFDAVWAAFSALQARLGGDGFIGRRLYGLFRRAGFPDVEISLQPEVHGHGSPGFEPWVRNMIGNVRSAERGLVESGLASPAEIVRAVSELEALLGRRDASAIFAWNRAAAVSPFLS